MHVLAIYAVNEHLADLLAEADNERRARDSRRPQESRRSGSLRDFLASIVETFFEGLTPTSPKLTSYPYAD